MNEVRAGLSGSSRLWVGRCLAGWSVAVLPIAAALLLTACHGGRSEQMDEARQNGERSKPSDSLISPDSSVVVHRHSAGRVMLGSRGSVTTTHVFQLINDRDRTMEVRDIKPTCVCIDVEVGAMHLAPGESADVRISMEVFSAGSVRHGAAVVLGNGDVEVFELHAVGVTSSELRVARETHLVGADGTHDVRLMLTESDVARTDVELVRPEFIADGLVSVDVGAWFVVEDGRSEASFRPWRGFSRATLRFRPDAPYPLTVTVRLAPLQDQTFVVDAAIQ